MLRIPPAESGTTVIKRILVRHILSLFRDREKVPVRRNFICVIRQGGFKVLRPRKLKCCDVVIFETSLGPKDNRTELIVRKCVNQYTNWELRL